MNEDKGRVDQGGDPDDLGEPILELQELVEDPSGGFMGRVLSSLRRRSLVGQMATLVWSASAQAFFEFLGMFFSLFDAGRPPEAGRPPKGGSK